MKKILIGILCFFVGHKITKHRIWDDCGEFYCPRCDCWFEYYEDPITGCIVEHEIKKESK